MSEEPAKKKLKVDAADLDVDVDNQKSTLLRQQVSEIIDNIKEKMENITNTEDGGDSSATTMVIAKASLGFLKLKSLQEKVLDEMKQTHSTLEKQRNQRDEEELKLSNLKYEKTLNEHALKLTNQIQFPNLLKLCCAELGIDEDKTQDTSANPTASSEVLSKFVGVDPNDMTFREIIIAKLNEEVTKRSNLETQLKISQHKAANLKKSLATKRKLLQELPHKLRDVERASQPLQKYCKKSLVGKSKESRKLSSDRCTNLDLAAALPKPLYTCYYQIQSYLDTMETGMGEQQESNTAALPLLEVSTDSSTVSLKIPVPTIAEDGSSSISKKMAIIEFEYNPKAGMLMARYATSTFSTNDMMAIGLIGELFPGDTGEWTMNDDEEVDTTTNKTTKKKQPLRKAYNWCNYLAGLHIAPEQQPAIQSKISTKVVVEALIRRVRAITTLQWLIQSNLARKLQYPFPVHTTMVDHLLDGFSNNTVKISSWIDQTASTKSNSSNNAHSLLIEGQNATAKIYQVKLKRKSTQILTVEVTIDLGRYPSITPVWNFMPPLSLSSDNHSDDSTTPLYDEDMATLERKVNCNVEDLVSSESEESCDWILSHQLTEIANGWDQILYQRGE